MVASHLSKQVKRAYAALVASILSVLLVWDMYIKTILYYAEGILVEFADALADSISHFAFPLHSYSGKRVSNESAATSKCSYSKALQSLWI